MNNKRKKIYILDGSASTVGELIELLSKIPNEYGITLCGFVEYSVAVDDTFKTILLDDSKWIEEHVYQLNEEMEEIE